MQINGKSEQPVLIIAGMHRSGTSLTASLLQSAGLDIGQHLLEGNFSNVKGHFENLDFFDFHRDVLFSLGLDDVGMTTEKVTYVPEYHHDRAKLLVQKNASFTKPWGWKDPRTTLFLNFWHVLLPEAKYLLIYRSPWEVLDSLYRRGDITFRQNPEFALNIWMNYNQMLLDFYHCFSEKCVLTPLKRVVENPTQFVAWLSQRLSIPLNTPSEDIYDCSLLKRGEVNSHRELLIQRYFPEAYTLYQQLNLAAGLSQEAPPLNQALLSPTAWLLQDWMDFRCLQKKYKDDTAALQTQLLAVKEELAKANQVTQQLQAEQHMLQEEKHMLQEEKRRIQQNMEQCLERNHQLNDELGRNHQLQAEWGHQLEHQQAIIAAMKTSKFWQLRSRWIKLKAFLHLKE